MLGINRALDTLGKKMVPRNGLLVVGDSEVPATQAGFTGHKAGLTNRFVKRLTVTRAGTPRDTPHRDTPQETLKFPEFRTSQRCNVHPE